MRFMFPNAFASILLLLPSLVLAQSEVDLRIRSTFAKRIPLAMAQFTAVDGASPEDATEMEQLVFLDLQFSTFFNIVRGQVPLAGNGDSGLVEVRGTLIRSGDEVHFEGRVVDAASGQSIGAKRYVIRDGQIRQVAHHFSDEVVRMLTGEPGVATSRILFRRKTQDRWEIVMADYDGYNPRVLVRQSVPILFPRWIDDNKGFVYTSFRHGTPDLFLRNIQETGSKRIASYDGINFSVDWSQKRKQLIVTLSKDGNAEVYILNKDGRVKRRLTHNRAIDVSPNWSPSGREVVFTSDRAGFPNIYIMGADGSNVRRLSYKGGYNDSAAWSPKGDLIVFVSRIDGFFQLCTIRPDGSDLRLLTSGAFDNEDPRWAPNGRHIVYSEKADGESLISIIDIATGGKRILSQGEAPDWSVR
jgi:TolB protein